MVIMTKKKCQLFVFHFLEFFFFFARKKIFFFCWKSILLENLCFILLYALLISVATNPLLNRLKVKKTPSGFLKYLTYISFFFFV